MSLLFEPFLKLTIWLNNIVNFYLVVQLDKQHSTEEKILNAARQIFIDRGMDGARMQDIADAAGINKAMLHYYFRSKEKLYGTIVQHIMSNALPAMFDLLESDLKLKDKLKQFIINYLALIRANPFLPLFILNEMNRHPDKFVKWLPIKNLKISRFSDQVNEAVSLKLIRPIEPKVLIINMASMIVFPFIAKPMMCVVLKMDKKYFDQLLSQREEQIINFVISRPPQKSGHKDKLEIILNSHIKSLLDVKNQEKIHEGAKARDSQHVTRRQSVS